MRHAREYNSATQWDDGRPHLARTDEPRSWVTGDSMKIVIFGLGYVGLTAAACLTQRGHCVMGVDVNERKVSQVNAGVSPVSEPGLERMLAEAVATGRLQARQDAGDSLSDYDVAIVCVGTPSMPDGSHNLSFIAEVSRQIAAAVGQTRQDTLTVVYRSTIRPGTMEQLILPLFRAALGQRMQLVELVYNPEFMRESVAVNDFFSPPKVVVGTVDGRPSPRMQALNAGIDAPIFNTRYREAEITKFVDNSFHALKVAFANEIGRICVDLGIDPIQVHQIFTADTKLNISAQYLQPGGAFGGSCLPKDVRALQNLSSDIGANSHVIDALLRSNDAHKRFLFDLCVEQLAPGSRVLMLGLAFKADSDDLRESPNLDLARRILQAGHRLSIYDPSLDPTKLVGQNLGYAYANLPELTDLLIDRDQLEASTFDCVIDNGGFSDKLRLGQARVVDVSKLSTRGPAPRPTLAAVSG